MPCVQLVASWEFLNELIGISVIEKLQVQFHSQVIFEVLRIGIRHLSRNDRHIFHHGGAVMFQLSGSVIICVVLNNLYFIFFCIFILFLYSDSSTWSIFSFKLRSTDRIYFRIKIAEF